MIYLNGLNTVIFAIIGILFELNTTVTIYNVNTKTIGWILFVTVVILTIVQIIYQIKDTKSIEKIEKEKAQIIFSLGNEKKKN